MSKEPFSRDISGLRYWEIFFDPSLIFSVSLYVFNVKGQKTLNGQAQLKLGLGFTLIFCIFGFSRFGLLVLVGLIWFCRFD